MQIKTRTTHASESYRGFYIDVRLEKSLGGYELVYYTVTRKKDDWEMTSGFSDTSDTCDTILGHMKAWVDDYYKNPDEYES